VKDFKVAGLNTLQRQQLGKEVEVFLALDHPHIARLLAVYEFGDYLALIMEHMEGGELYDRLKERTNFTEDDAATAVWQMLLALNYLHSHRIVHADIKLENFLFESDRKESLHVKLIDFGLSAKYCVKGLPKRMTSL